MLFIYNRLQIICLLELTSEDNDLLEIPDLDDETKLSNQMLIYQLLFGEPYEFEVFLIFIILSRPKRILKF